MYNSNGLKIKEVEMGWGGEAEAIEFPLNFAEDGLLLLEKHNKEFPDVKNPSHEMLKQYCLDTIDCNKNNETMYILDCFWASIIKILNGLNK